MQKHNPIGSLNYIFNALPKPPHPFPREKENKSQTEILENKKGGEAFCLPVSSR
jgi:hypothetical protein